MHRDNNIFYKAVKKDENHITDLFCNLLKYDFIRNYLLKFFKLPVENLEYDDIDTQLRIEENNKQPDIIIKNEDIYCFFEIKVRNSKLYDSQINEYFQKLEKEENKRMIYLIPKNYKEKTKIEKAIENKNYAKIYYWEDFIRYIENSDLPQSNIIISEFIIFLKNVLGKQDLSLTLNLEEMALLQNPKDLIVAKNLLNKLYDIIDKSALKVVEYFGDKIKIYDQTKRKEISNEYAVYFTDKDEEYILFFGLWFAMVEDDFEKYGDKLMCFGVSIDDDEYDFNKYLEKFEEISENKNFKTGGWLLSYFDKYGLATEKEDELIDNVAKKLINTIKKLLK